MSDMLRNVRKRGKRLALLVNRALFHVYFKRFPAQGSYCNSKFISVVECPDRSLPNRDYLAFIRCGAAHRLIDDGGERIFDIALNGYAELTDTNHADYEYLIAGGINKYMAARQFVDDDLLARYKGFIFLDDDLAITYSELGNFLSYCTLNDLSLAQPSLTRDSHFSHEHLLNAAESGWRRVDMVEVMCPYFSSETLKTAIRTFDLSYSTWGLDYIWPKLLKTRPVVVDEFTIRHTKPRSKQGCFYKYMAEIGIAPEQEMERLRNTPLDKLRI